MVALSLIAACTSAEPPVLAWHDDDGDGFGAGEAVELVEGSAGTGFVDNDDDCDDGDAMVHPGSHDDECHDGVPTDMNCDQLTRIGGVDEFFVSSGRVDDDHDGYGGRVVSWPMCDTMPEEVEPDLDARPDCDDHDPDVHPLAEELCDGIDNDCDDEIDERC